MMNNSGYNKNKKGQEEMVGFIVIVVLVSVVLLVLLGFMLKSSNKGVAENYEVESFIQSALQYTTTCETEIGLLSVQNLIASCDRGIVCLDGENSCDVLNNTLKNMVKRAWNVNNQSAVKGYKLTGMTGERGIFLLQEGNETRNYKGGMQDFAKSGNSYEVSFNVYS